jgi:hypothetical protein
MTYRHPLAYLMGVEGFALLRAYAGEYDQEFVEARLAEMRVLLDAATLIGDGIDAGEIDTVEGYRAHAAGYDRPGNGLIDIEQPIVSHSCWDLHEWCPDAVRAAFTGTPVAIIWHFQRAEDR